MTIHGNSPMKGPSVQLIYARSEDHVIGDKSIPGGMPWRCPADFRFFKAITEGTLCIMGRNTAYDIANLSNRQNSREALLPERICVILSKTIKQFDGAFVVDSIESLMDSIAFNTTFSNHRISVIGGASVYNHFIENDLVDIVYETVIKDSFDTGNTNIIKLPDYQFNSMGFTKGITSSARDFINCEIDNDRLTNGVDAIACDVDKNIKITRKSGNVAERDIQCWLHNRIMI